MANIRSVAAEAGVSIATVSRILSGDADFKVSDITRQSVLDAASRMHYARPSTAHRQKKISIGCILPFTVEKYSDPFFTSILSSAEAECSRLGAVISVIRNYNELREPSVFRELLLSGLSGIFLMERVHQDLLSQLEASIPSILCIDNDETDYQFDSVGFDPCNANRMVMRCLLTRGYQRIAMIGGSSPNDPFYDSVRLTIYRESLHHAGLPYREAYVRDCAWDLDLCAAQARELLSLEEPPDAIIAGSDSLATAILGTIHAMGLRCPDDVGVIGFNNINLSAHMVPPLTTVSVPTREIGIAAAQRLMELVHGKGCGIRKILFPTELIVRSSLREQ